MFKKVFKSLSKALSTKEPVADTAPAPTTPAPKKAEVAAKAVPTPEAKGKGKLLDKVAPLKPASPEPAAPKKSPEELCEITPQMSKDEIKVRLAFLYRRYNRATSSLDAKLRAEADLMLDAVVAIREKVFGPL